MPFEIPPTGKEVAPMLAPQQFAAQQVGAITAFLPTALIAGGLLYFGAKFVRKIGSELGIMKKEK